MGRNLVETVTGPPNARGGRAEVAEAGRVKEEPGSSVAEAEQSGRLVVRDEYGMVRRGRPSKVSEAFGEDFRFCF